MGKLHLHLPNRPDGDMVEVPPYGLLKNNGTYEFDSLEEDVHIPPLVIDVVNGPVTNHVDDILAWVGDDPERAKRAAAAEPLPRRRTLMPQLERVIERGNRPEDPGRPDEPGRPEDPGPRRSTND